MYQETLTAYKCEFKYRRRENPKYDEQKELIKNNVAPDLSVHDFLDKYIKSVNGYAIGKNADRAVKILENDINNRGTGKWYLKIRAGKQGRPFVTIDGQSGKINEYKNTTAALYENNVFVYEKDGYFITIFHRRNGSGCKSVFLETANDMLRKEGLILEMKLVVSAEDEHVGGIATEIRLLQLRNDISSDDADNIKSRKAKIVRDIGLNLIEQENYGILNIFHKFQRTEISKEEAFMLIKKSIPGVDDYNDGIVTVKIQGRPRQVKWSQLESIIGTHDITSALENIIRDSESYIYKIGELSDRYCEDIERTCDALDN